MKTEEFEELAVSGQVRQLMPMQLAGGTSSGFKLGSSPPLSLGYFYSIIQRKNPTSQKWK
jgi:hypothetical protein